MSTKPSSIHPRRKICSYDMAEVPASSYRLRAADGEMYFCNNRCLCIWAITFATHPRRPEPDQVIPVDLLSPDGRDQHFPDVLALAKWAAANLLGDEEASPV